MGTIINSIVIEKSNGQKGIVELISTVAKACLYKASVEINTIGMLINTGIYSENLLKEPALASLVLKRLLKQNIRSKTYSNRPDNLLSFDMHNGGGGIVNAIQVIDGFISSGEIEHGLVVSGDIKPKKGIIENYNYSEGAAAMLVSKDNSKKGFMSFKTETFPEYENDFSSSTSWENGSLTFVHKQSLDYLDIAVQCTVKVMNRFFEEKHLNWENIDFVCTSQSPSGFASELQKKLQVKKKIVQLNDEMEMYSSGLFFSIKQIFKSKEFSNAKNILLVTAGAGITVSLAYYINE